MGDLTGDSSDWVGCKDGATAGVTRAGVGSSVIMILLSIMAEDAASGACGRPETAFDAGTTAG